MVNINSVQRFSALQPQECSCGGSNENCYHCYGTGIARDRGRPPVTGGEVRKKRRTSSGAVTESIEPKPHFADQACPKCGFHGTHEEVIAHGTKAHEVKQIDCAFCSFVGTRIQLKEHQKSCRSLKAVKNPNRGNVSSRFTRYQCNACAFTGSFDLVRSHARFDHSNPHLNAKCPLCRASMKMGHLNRHLRRKHGIVEGPELAAVLRQIKVGFHRVDKPKLHGRTQASLKTEPQIVSQEDVRAERKLDRTKLYAHAYREHGRYGSHPVHDGFDDESTP
jgi:hypothetical protein